MTKAAHLPRLDGLRGVAALGVMIFHLRLIYTQANPLEDLAVFHWLQSRGWMLVDLFFVLSGFVFAHAYLESGKMRKSTTLRQFTWARIARLWPLHLTMLAFAAFVLRNESSTTLENIALSGAMLHLLIEQDNVLNAPAWSISVEVICYALFALGAIYGRNSLSWLAPLAIAVGCWMIGTDQLASLGRGLTGFFSGLLLFRFQIHAKGTASFLLLPLCLIPFAIEPDGMNLAFITIAGWTSVVVISLQTGILERRAFQWLGDRSYAIYLSHVPILILINNLSYAWSFNGEMGIAIATPLTIGVILVISNFLYLQIERPAQKALLSLASPRPQFKKELIP